MLELRRYSDNSDKREDKLEKAEKGEDVVEVVVVVVVVVIASLVASSTPLALAQRMTWWLSNPHFFCASVLKRLTVRELLLLYGSVRCWTVLACAAGRC